MLEALRKLIGNHINFVFVGEAGSGKSEIAVNFAKWLVDLDEKTVHFFDIDVYKRQGLERYEMIEAYNLGSQVPNEEFIEKMSIFLKNVK